MANHLPPGVLPKITRVKVNGKEIGNYRIMIAGKFVNLRTQDYFKARERAREAVNDGKRDFTDDKREPLALLPSVNGESPKRATSDAGDWTVDVSSAGSTPEQPPITPEVFSPEDKPRIETKATDGNAEFGASVPNGGSSTRISPDMLKGLIAQGAMALVELQLMLQSWLFAKGLKIEVGKLDDSHEGRKVGRDAWEQALREMIPAEIPIPPLLAAPLMTATATIPGQLEHAKPIPKKEPEPPKES